jgi:hypothetical protein
MAMKIMIYIFIIDISLYICVRLSKLLTPAVMVATMTPCKKIVPYLHLRLWT